MNLLKYFKRDPQFIVNSNKKLGLHSVKYQSLGVDWSKPYMLEARGLVVNNFGKVIARPYRKFFNYKQYGNGSTISNEVIQMCEWDDDDDYVVLDKLDGSLAIVTAYKKKFLFCSSGAVEGDFALKFRKCMFGGRSEEWKDKFMEFCKYFTFIFEFVSPKNPIVLKYEEEKMVLHGIIHTKTGTELDYKQLQECADFLDFDLVKLLPKYDKQFFSKQAQEEKGIEGFIVWWPKTGKRIKIKTDEYVEYHDSTSMYFGRMNTKRKNKHIIQLIMDNEIDDVLAQCRIYERTRTVEHIELVMKYYAEMKEKHNKAISLIESDGFSYEHFFKEQMSSDREFNTLVAMSSSNNVEKLDRFYKKQITNKLFNFTEENNESINNDRRAWSWKINCHRVFKEALFRVRSGNIFKRQNSRVNEGSL